MDEDVNDDMTTMTFQCILLLWQSFAQLLASNASLITDHTHTASKSALPFQISKQMRTNLLNVGPDLHISGWSLLLGIIGFVLHCNI